MKKTLLLISSIFLIFLVFSCKKTQYQQVNTLPVDKNFVSLSLATFAASHVDNSSTVKTLQASYLQERKTNSINSPNAANLFHKEVSDVIAGPDKNNPSYYIFSFKNGGFVIIAADKRVEPILAYSEEGGYDRSGSMPQGLMTWLIKNDNNMQKVRKNDTINAPVNIVKMWSELLAESNNPSSQTTSTYPSSIKVLKDPPPPPVCQDYTTTTTVGPLLPTQWGQGQGFNNFCPTGTYSNGHVPSGCVATAMSQIIRYWHFPNTYNWNMMPDNSGSDEVSRLMANVGSAVGMSYSDNGSGASSGNIAPAFINNFGYNTALYNPYNYSNLKININASQPVILSAYADHYTTGWWFWTTTNYANGHAWVCDGYEHTDWFQCGYGGGYYDYLHMNWGWNENWVSTNYNGWYNESNWTVSRSDATLSFNYNKDMVFNIHP